MPIRVILADDQDLYREEIGRLLQDQPDIEVIDKALDKFEAVEKVRAAQPDVVLLDLAMPPKDGLGTLTLIRQVSPASRMIVLARDEKGVQIDQVLNAGALGYIVKGAHQEELFEAVRTVARGAFYISTDVQCAVLTSYLESARPRPRRHYSYNKLTDREKQVFQLLVKGKSRTQIGELLFISAKTVDKHRANISKKIGITSPAQMVLYAIRNELIESS